MTVLIVLASATIAALVVKVAVAAQGGLQRRQAAVEARETVRVLEARVFADLAADPLRPFAEVLEDESPRVCDGDLTTYPDPITPGSAWPATCGQFWSYAGSSSADSGVRLYPPGPDDNGYVVESFARVGNQRAGLRSTLVPGGRERPALLADDDLDLDTLVSGSVTVTGPVYSSGSLDVGSASLSGDVLLAAEDSMTVRPEGVPVALPAASALEGDVPVRNVYPLPLGVSQLGSSLETLRVLACLDESPSRVDGFSTGLCVQAGRTLVDVSGDAVVVPSLSAAPALLAVLDGDGHLLLYGRPAAPAVWPDTLASWGDPLGEFELPATGVVYFDRDVVFGHCAEVSGACDDWAGDGVPGMTVDAGVTLVVGSLFAPADLHVGGPVNAGAHAAGAVVSGAVRFPAAAVPAAGSLTVDLWLAVVGADGDVLSAVAGDSAASRPSLTLTAPLLLAAASVDVGTFLSVSLDIAGSPLDSPPLFPSPGLGFQVDHRQRMTDGELRSLLPGEPTGAGVPSVPPRFTAAASIPGSGEVVLSWRTPSDGGDPITDYLVEYKLAADETWTAFADGTSTALGATVTALSAGSYEFRVAAVNAVGSSAWTAPASTVVVSVPSAPSITSVTPGDQQLTVAFAAPASNGGVAITDYEYTLDDGASWLSSATTTSPFTIIDNDPGETYSISLRAVNSVGASASSATATGYFAIPPSAPTIIATSSADFNITVSFSAPADDGNGSITNYQYSLDDGATWVTRSPASTSSPLLLGASSLNGGFTYDIRMRAVNVAGPGTASAAVQGISAARPDMVSVGLTPLRYGIKVQWLAPDDNGANIDAYLVEWSTATSFDGNGDPVNFCSGGNTCDSATVSGATLSYNISGLQAGRQYFVRVRAQNIAGWSFAPNITNGGALAYAADYLFVGYSSPATFSMSQTSQTRSPTLSGGWGTKTFSYGTCQGCSSSAWGGWVLPTGVTFDTTTGTFTGPASWNIEATSIATGDQHTCASFDDGSVRCWGRNSGGQVGDGTYTSRSTPVTIFSGGALQVVAGSLHSCALFANGTVQCWGNNLSGQLGNGTTTSSTSPVVVSGISSAIEISAGTNHSCAHLSGGTVRCWGNNLSGQLGDGTSTSSSTPVEVSGLSLVTGLSAGLATGHTCAVVSGGGAWCWGDNTSGQLGDGSYTSSLTPVSVSGVSNAEEVVAGGAFSCARLLDGTVSCWGAGTSGQLGNGMVTRPTAAVVSGLSSVVDISAGSSHACAVSSSTPYCWGAGSFGRRGWASGSTTDSATPASVSYLTGQYPGSAWHGAAQVSAGGSHGCAITKGGGVRCWGQNATQTYNSRCRCYVTTVHGQLGYNYSSSYTWWYPSTSSPSGLGGNPGWPAYPYVYVSDSSTEVAGPTIVGVTLSKVP